MMSTVYSNNCSLTALMLPISTSLLHLLLVALKVQQQVLTTAHRKASLCRVVVALPTDRSPAVKPAPPSSALTDTRGSALAAVSTDVAPLRNTDTLSLCHLSIILPRPRQRPVKRWSCHWEPRQWQHTTGIVGVQRAVAGVACDSAVTSEVGVGCSGCCAHL
jgi:hypothetical protein